jgi:integrase
LRLTARTVAGLIDPGRHGDGQGLYLSISHNGGRRWVWLYRWDGRTRELGLGSARTVTLAKARELAAIARNVLAQGRDPIAEKRKVVATTPTFGELADQIVSSLESGWRNEKHRKQWRMTLTRYAAPLRDKPVDTITVEHVLGVLMPLWTTRPATASRLRGRIEKVLDAATARRLRAGVNPAVWRGNLDHLLPRSKRLARVHHAALPFNEVPAFVSELSGQASVVARALTFVILTGVRSGEALGARWDEIDFVTKVWTIPAARMKAGRAHRVPLSAPALTLLRQMEQQRSSDLVFPGRRPGKPLSSVVFFKLLRHMHRQNITAHGFRSAFRDFAGEQTNFPREVAEEALAHFVGDATERAYRRSDALEKRRELMQCWGDFCTGARGEIVPLRVRL